MRLRRPDISPMIIVVVAATDWQESAVRLWTDTEAMAKELFQVYPLPFEVVSVLLLAAVIGGVYIAKREKGSAA